MNTPWTIDDDLIRDANGKVILTPMFSTPEVLEYIITCVNNWSGCTARHNEPVTESLDKNEELRDD